eukprot:222617_1
MKLKPCDAVQDWTTKQHNKAIKHLHASQASRIRPLSISYPRTDCVAVQKKKQIKEIFSIYIYGLPYSFMQFGLEMFFGEIEQQQRLDKTCLSQEIICKVDTTELWQDLHGLCLPNIWTIQLAIRQTTRDLFVKYSTLQEILIQTQHYRIATMEY